MERKKITFDSFIRGVIGCVMAVGILMLVERLSGVLLPFFIAWLIAYMILSAGQILSIQVKVKKSYPFHFLCFVSDYCCGSITILSVGSADGFRDEQNERSTGELSDKRRRQQCS